MSNHFHILVKENVEGGISKFMHRVGTSFTKYYNLKHNRIGNVFVKPFRSKHIKDDRYYKRIAQYIHLNPAEIFEPKWKSGEVRQMDILKKQIQEYKYSSLLEYSGVKRPENSILDNGSKELLKELPPFSQIIDEAALYYTQLSM